MRTARLLLAGAVAAACVCALAVGSASAALWTPTTRGAYSFVSAPHLHPPKLKWVVKNRSKLAHGYFFVANTPNLASKERMSGQSGAEILDNHGHPVWFQPVSRNVVANNLTLQSYNGQPALSYWQGVENSQGVIKTGEDIVLDQHYKKVATLKGQHGWIIDLHEMVISGTDAWVIASKTVSRDLRKEGGPRHGKVIDTAVQEYDLRNGHLLYTWDPLNKHVPLTDSHTRPSSSSAWDAYHANSLQILNGGKSFLVSMRNTWGAYMVDKASHHILWQLGGKHSTFSFGRGAEFEFQHDVMLHAGNVVTMFDNHCCGVNKRGQFIIPKSPSRGLVLKLDLTHFKASKAAQYTLGPHFLVLFQGNTEQLSNGNVVLGWGSTAQFSEFNGAGNRQLLQAKFPGIDQTYRATLQHWIGLPAAHPGGAVRTKGGRATVYASWNGTTQTKKWRVLAGSSSTHLSRVATKAMSNFETAIKLSKTHKVYEVEALDGKGHVLGRSKPFS